MNNIVIARPRHQTVIALAIFVSSATLFALLQSRQYLAIDGATRALLVYWHPRPIAGGNNHLLYFVNVYTWSRIAALFGREPRDAFEFIRSAQWMNASAAGGCVSLLFVLCSRAAKNVAVAVIAASAYGFSHAFIAHATSTSEPMVGLLWSGLSAWAVASGLAGRSSSRLFIGGALLALAMATYQSMVFIGPAELALISFWDKRGLGYSASRLICYLSGCVLGGILIYSPVYAISGTTNASTMFHRFFNVEGGQVYGGFRLSKLLNLPIGFSNSLLPAAPPDYQGIRWLFGERNFDRATCWFIVIVLGIAGWTIWTIRRAAVVWHRLTHLQQLIVACCAVAVVFDLSSLLYWDPLYDKLWLQPLATVFLLWSIIFKAWRPTSRRRVMLLPEGLLFAGILVTGITGSFESHASPTPCLDAAHKLAKVLRPADLLVSGWDPVSLLYASFWESGARTFSVPQEATEAGANTPRSLNRAIAAARNRGGKVYFLGLLDMPKNVWQPFLGEREHMPYNSLESLRQCANPLRRLVCGPGRDETLWQLPPACRGQASYSE